MKVVINKCWGGFGLSELAYKALIKKGWTVTFLTKEGNYKNSNADICDTQGGKYPSEYYINGYRYGLVGDKDDPELRSHPDLIGVVEKLGKKANGPCAQLEIIEIPDGVKFYIDDYDGMESVNEDHRSWG